DVGCSTCALSSTAQRVKCGVDGSAGLRDQRDGGDRLTCSMEHLFSALRGGRARTCLATAHGFLVPPFRRLLRSRPLAKATFAWKLSPQPAKCLRRACLSSSWNGPRGRSLS
ncbi:unnamed protein product, partial [Ectocarpus sp. 12 AP-2014]